MIGKSYVSKVVNSSSSLLTNAILKCRTRWLAEITLFILTEGFHNTGENAFFTEVQYNTVSDIFRKTV